jgi:uncharacterized caspase-like protein
LIGGLLVFSTLSFAGASDARAAGRKILVIGSDIGLRDEDPLRHAVEDARRMAAVLTELAGSEAPDVRLLANPTVEVVLSALGSLAAPPRAGDAVIVYFSGHGGEEALHIGGESLPLERLRQALARVDVPLKIIIIDACRTTDRRTKGLKVDTGFSVSLPGAVGQYRGQVMLLASGPGEAAQESARLGGGVFTHFLVSGLRGAADRDGDRRVTLGEAYDFAHARTLARSVAQTGTAQRPEMQLALEGSGPLVLTWLDPARSRLLLPAIPDAHFYVYEKGSNVLTAEAWGRADGETTVALPSGRFVVHRQLGPSHGVAEVSLPFGGEARLAGSKFVDVSAEEAVARGGHMNVLKSSLALVGGVVLDGEQRPGAAVSVRYLRARSDLLWGAGLSASSADSRSAYNRAAVQRLDAAAIIGWQRAASRFSAYAFVELTARLERMRLDDLSTGDVLPESQRPSITELTVGGGPGVRAGVMFPFSLHLALVAEMGARAIAFRERTAAGSIRLAVSREVGFDTGIAISF